MQVYSMSSNVPSPKVRDMATPNINDVERHTLPTEGRDEWGYILLNNHPNQTLETFCKEPDCKYVMLCRSCGLYCNYSTLLP